MGIFFINIIHGTWLPTTSTLVPALNMIINIIHGVTARPQAGRRFLVAASSATKPITLAYVA